MTQYDYEAAIAEVESILHDIDLHIDGDISKKYAIEQKSIFETLLHAAKIAKRLEQEPSEEMENAGDEPFHAEIKAQNERAVRCGYPKGAYSSCEFSRAIYKAMVEQLKKEVQYEVA